MLIRFNPPFFAELLLFVIYDFFSLIAADRDDGGDRVDKAFLFSSFYYSERRCFSSSSSSDSLFPVISLTTDSIESLEEVEEESPRDFLKFTVVDVRFTSDILLFYCIFSCKVNALNSNLFFSRSSLASRSSISL